MKNNLILAHYWPEIQKYKTAFFLMLFSLTIAIAAELVTPFFVRNIIDLIGTGTTENYQLAMDNLKNIAWAFAVLWLAWRVNEYLISLFQVKVMKDLYNRCFKTVQKQSWRFFTDNFTGSLVKKVTKFVRSFETLHDIFYFNFANQFIHLLFVFIILFRDKPQIGLIFLVWTIFFIGANYWFALWKMKFDKSAARADSKISASLSDSFSNYPTVKIFAQENREQIRFRSVYSDWYQKTKFTWILSCHVNAIQGFFMLALEIVIYFLAIKGWQKGTFTAGDFVFIQSYLLWTFHRLWDFGRNVRMFASKLADAQEMVDIFNRSNEVEDFLSAEKLKLTKGGIHFKEVYFSYFEQKEISDKKSSSMQIFSNLNLKIKPEEKIAIVGHSGSGKSTFVKILLRFYNLQTGKILVDDQDIAKVSPQSLRQNISLVPQDPDLFHRSISENIAYGKPNASEAEIIKAAKLAHADKFIQKFPQAYQTLVGERGVKLSGGEKQRIAIARAILEDKKILVLDEATSSLDSVTEKEIQIAINNAMKKKTVIVIAHRLSTIKKVDRVLVFDNGKIIETGSHEELLNKKGKYAELWEHQVGGFIS
jgi:ATP-binding cassette, subfamily B, bacterial